MLDAVAVPKAPREIAEAIILPANYADVRGIVQPACRWLRQNMPIALAEVDGYDPVWLITKHAHIREIMRNAQLFHSADINIMLHTQAGDAYLRDLLGGNTKVLKNLSYMEPPEHTKYRGATAFDFLPAQVQKFAPRFREIAKAAVDRLIETGGECDFVATVARDYPLNVILEMLGIPPADFPLVLKMTQDTFGGDDPDAKRDDVAEMTPEASAKHWLLAVEGTFHYFDEIRKDRHAHPRDDLTTSIVTAKLEDGSLMPEEIQIHLAASIAIAGHDTINAALSGGVLGLARHPDQLRKAKDDPSLIPSLVDECLRYATPTKHFMRNTTQPTNFHGIEIAKMDRLMCLFISGNNDEEVFANPESFDAARKPNPHLAFGFGPHICLGQHLAKIEMQELFKELLPRIGTIELAGEPRPRIGNFVTGLKTLPIRFTRA